MITLVTSNSVEYRMNSQLQVANYWYPTQCDWKYPEHLVREMKIDISIPRSHGWRYKLHI
jgi:hypothetical protein